MKSNDTPTTNIGRYAEQQGMDIQIQPETNQNQPNITNTELFTNNDRPDQHKQSKAPKRQISQSPEIRENTEDSNLFTVPTRKPLKKPKNDKKTYEKFEEIIANKTPPYTLNANELRDFLENSTPLKNVINIAKNYTQDLPSLTKMLKDLRPFAERTVKNKITRIINTLTSSKDEEILITSEDETDKEPED
ncbi:hypothetical protein HHI36_000310 [Cryptolaemus montrouzieri]|uniref:Uncharacterized protein n=1 Tax=Cryptolaemus montrouzieri TaxID=559131 RepID=A0ABD2P4Q2_9CUCU